MNSNEQSHPESCDRHLLSCGSPLPNPRHEIFAQEVASGRNATQAYTNVYGTENRRAAASAGYRLLRRKGITERIQSIQQAGAVRVAMALRKISTATAPLVTA